MLQIVDQLILPSNPGCEYKTLATTHAMNYTLLNEVQTHDVCFLCNKLPNQINSIRIGRKNEVRRRNTIFRSNAFVLGLWHPDYMQCKHNRPLFVLSYCVATRAYIHCNMHLLCAICLCCIVGIQQRSIFCSPKAKQYDVYAIQHQHHLSRLLNTHIHVDWWLGYTELLAPHRDTHTKVRDGPYGIIPILHTISMNLIEHYDLCSSYIKQEYQMRFFILLPFRSLKQVLVPCVRALYFILPPNIDILVLVIYLKISVTFEK